MKTLRMFCVGLALLAGSGTLVQAQQPVLERVLQRSLAERVQIPLVFSTRDSLFALSLPTADEGPAEVYVQLTVGRNGRVKEKKTRVNANHVGQYVAPAFIAAAKGLRIDRDSVPALAGRDTSVVLTFPLEYRCVLDTMTKAWPNAGDRLRESVYNPCYFSGSPQRPLTLGELDDNMRGHAYVGVSAVESQYRQAIPTPIWYYLVFWGDLK